MKLYAVGHLTHGYKINFSGKAHTGINYGLSKKDEYLDYDEILRIADECKPKVIAASASVYSRLID